MECNACKLPTRCIRCPTCDDVHCLHCIALEKDEDKIPTTYPRARTSTVKNMYNELYPDEDETWEELLAEDPSNPKIEHTQQVYADALKMHREEMKSFTQSYPHLKAEAETQMAEAKKRKAARAAKNKAARAAKRGIETSEPPQAIMDIPKAGKGKAVAAESSDEDEEDDEYIPLSARKEEEAKEEAVDDASEEGENEAEEREHYQTPREEEDEEEEEEEMQDSKKSPSPFLQKKKEEADVVMKVQEAPPIVNNAPAYSPIPPPKPVEVVQKPAKKPRKARVKKSEIFSKMLNIMQTMDNWPMDLRMDLLEILKVENSVEGLQSKMEAIHIDDDEDEAEEAMLVCAK